MSRIFITGDTHGDMSINKLSNKTFPENKKLTKDDFVIICGDFGLVWDNSKSEIYWRDWLTNNRNFTTLFVDGNHESFFLLNLYPISEWNGGKVHKITDSIIHLIRGEVYTIGSKKFFVMGGADSVDKLRRIEGVSWWKEELPSYIEYENGLSNLEKHGWKVDYVITHTCPLKVFGDVVENGKTMSDLEKYLDNIDNSLEFKEWYFGHYHQDKWINNKYRVIYNDIVEIIS